MIGTLVHFLLKGRKKSLLEPVDLKELQAITGAS